jgi:predicted nucleotidyltransferase
VKLFVSLHTHIIIGYLLRRLEGCVERMVELKGENQVKKFRQIAEGLVSEVSSFEGVAGIVFIGGLVRGFADRFSDVDIIVFLSRKDEGLRKRIRDLGLDVEKRFGVDADLEVHFLEDFKRRKWDEVDRWEFSRAEIVFDPKGEVKKVFGEKLRVRKGFWIRRIVVCGEYLKWYCCPPKADVGTVAECWVERGDLVSAHYCLTYATDLLVRIVFALNREFLPAPKWRIFYSYGLGWLPENYRELLGEALLVKSFSVEDFGRRLGAIRELWCGVLPKIREEMGLTAELISKYYVEKVLHQV